MMAECRNCDESGSSRNLYPALAVAALAGVALTYFIIAKKTKTTAEGLPVDKVVNICNTAAAKLDAYVSQALAS